MRTTCCPGGLVIVAVAATLVAAAAASAPTTTFIVDEPSDLIQLAPQPPSTFVFGSNPGDLILAGGAALSQAGVAPLFALRSGNPPAHTSAALRVLLNPGATVTRATFLYRYNTGFGPTGVGTNFTLAVAGQPAYASPHLTDYTYGHNKSNYSLPVAVDAASLAIVVPKTVPSHVEFLFANNQRKRAAAAATHRHPRVQRHGAVHTPAAATAVARAALRAPTEHCRRA